jgi:hypothetical protein
MRLSILLVVAFSVVAATIAMLFDRRTRPIGLILLTVPAALLLFLAVLLITQPAESVPSQGVPVAAGDFTAGSLPTSSQPNESGTAADATPTPTSEQLELKVTASESKLEITPMPGTTVEALFKAVGNALTEMQRQRNPRAAKGSADGGPSERSPSDGSVSGGPGAASSAASEDRPPWVDRTPGRTDQGNYEMVAVVGPFTTREECDQALPAALEKAATAYAEKYLGAAAAARLDLSPALLRRHLIADRFEERIEASVGPMVQLHVLLQFDDVFNNVLKERWHRVRVQQRIAGVGLLMGLTLSLIFVAFAYLRIDLASGGAYRGRLKLAAAVVILSLMTGTWLLTVS